MKKLILLAVFVTASLAYAADIGPTPVGGGGDVSTVLARATGAGGPTPVGGGGDTDALSPYAYCNPDVNVSNISLPIVSGSTRVYSEGTSLIVSVQGQLASSGQPVGVATLAARFRPSTLARDSRGRLRYLALGPDKNMQLSIEENAEPKNRIDIIRIFGFGVLENPDGSTRDIAVHLTLYCGQK